MTNRIVAAAAMLLVHSANSASVQVRDTRPAPRTGTAAIVGVVVTDDREPLPLRRARVSISAGELDLSLAAITADDGTFAFRGVPAGHYSVSARKDGYVSASQRLARPDIALTEIDVRHGDTRHVTLRLTLGAVITGALQHPNGEAAAGISVTALAQRYNPALGLRRPAPAAPAVTTDDRGVYRIFGLAPGAYVIRCMPRASPGLPTGDIQVITDADVRRALSEVKAQTFASRPGMPPPLSPPARPPERSPTVALTPIYYPGTPVLDRAAPVTVRAGEVRTGIDFDIDYVATVQVEGFVPVTPGTRVQVTMTAADPSGGLTGARTSVPDVDGRFTFRGTPPGHYAITARTPSLAGRTEVIVAGEDISGISIALKPLLSVSGRIVFETEGEPPVLPVMRIPISAASFSEGPMAALPPITLDGHAFSIRDVVPGVYRAQTLLQGIRTAIGPWWLKSVIVNRREMLDMELDLRESDDNAVITFSDRASELSGVARYAGGSPVRAGHVVVFSADPRMWFHNSRRVAGLQPTAEGRYVVRNLPPGSYLVAVANGLDRNEWFDPEVLAALAPHADRITLREHERKVHDVLARLP